MISSLKILIAFTITALMVAVAGIFLTVLQGLFLGTAVCIVGAIALLAITLVLLKDLRIKRMLNHDDFPYEE